MIVDFPADNFWYDGPGKEKYTFIWQVLNSLKINNSCVLCVAQYVAISVVITHGPENYLLVRLSVRKLLFYDNRSYNYKIIEKG